MCMPFIRDQNGSGTYIDPEDQALTPRFLTSLHDLEVMEQDSVRIQCRVGGRPPPDIQWYSNGLRLVEDSRHKIIVNESGCHTLLISNIQLSGERYQSQSTKIYR